MEGGDWDLAKDFPERVDLDGSGEARTMARIYRGPSEFRTADGATHLRLETVTSWTPTPRGVLLDLSGQTYENRFVQTHETQMHQFSGGGHEHTSGALIEAFAPGVTRVRLGRDPSQDPYSHLPAHSRMLVADPDPALGASVAEVMGTREGAAAIVMDAGGDGAGIRVRLDPFRLSLVDSADTEIWAQKKRDLFTSDVFDAGEAQWNDRRAFFDSFELRERERIVGLGERFDGVLRNGRAVDFRNKDAIGSSSGRTYINVPFYISSAGYGLFVNSSANPEWEIGTQDLTTLGVVVEDEILDYFVIHGPDPSTILKRYGLLTGLAPVPPVWSFGLWLSRNSYTSWDMVDQIAAEADKEHLPFDVVNLDPAWFTETYNCDLRFSPDRFPDPEGHMRALRERGIRVCLWQYNFIPPRENNANYREALDRAYLVTGSDGLPYRYPEDTVGSRTDETIIDFTNPDAAEWYAAQIRGLVRSGVSSIKVDYGEGIPDEGNYHALPGKRVHNIYSLFYNACIARAIHDETGEWIVWARSGTAGSQRYPVHWGGDGQCSWAGLAGTVKGAISTGLSGIPFYSHDIGGFIGRPSEELYIRWAQFGLLSSHARTHGNGNTNSREPWSFGSDAARIFRRFAELRYSLLPYLLSTAQEASRDGLPVIRSLLLAYPDDYVAWTIEDEYLLGSDLLVAPVLRPLTQAKVRDVYLPAGSWYDFWTNERIDSDGRWIAVPVTLESIPIYVRAGAVIPYTEARTRTENRVTPIIRVEAYAPVNGHIGHGPHGAAGRSSIATTRRLEIDNTEHSFTLRGSELETVPALDADLVVIGPETGG
ncbi:MAG: hypothetical protein KOO61_04060 [Spirochaetales bacterium]|nr:hypothetical protein [Spirochaetales bacterium]